MALYRKGGNSQFFQKKKTKRRSKNFKWKYHVEIIRRMSSPQTWLCRLGTTDWKPSPANVLLGKSENLDEILVTLKSVTSFGTDINEAKVLSLLFCSCSVFSKECIFLLRLHMKAGLESYVCTYCKKVYSFAVNMPQDLLIGYELKE